MPETFDFETAYEAACEQRVLTTVSKGTVKNKIRKLKKLKMIEVKTERSNKKSGDIYQKL